MQLVHHCLLLPCVDGICWPNFSSSALARLGRTAGVIVLSGLECKNSALSEMWAVGVTVQVQSSTAETLCSHILHMTITAGVVL